MGNGIRASMAPAQDPLAIAVQTMLQAPYAIQGSVSITIKLTRWFGNIVGDIVKVEGINGNSTFIQR